MINFENIFNRVDYNQIGLTSVNTLRAIDFSSNVLVCVGDHTGSVDCFLIKTNDQSTPETLFKTLPNANSKINCVEIVTADTKSPKFIVSFGSSIIRGFNKKGKQFFGLELNNLTEPIKHLRLKWPNEIFVAGQFIFNHYVISSDDAKSKSSMVQNRNCYISPGKINCLQVIDEKINHKSVSILACEDRLIRVLMDSTCEVEIETSGICNVISRIADYNQYLSKSKAAKSQVNSKIYYFCYGTSNGRLSMLKIDFNKSPIVADHCWEVNLEQSKSAIQCITPTVDLWSCTTQETKNSGFTFNEASELWIGRVDGSIEMFMFENYIHCEDGNEIVNIENEPKLIYEYNCGERLTSIAICRYGQLIICCTFTGCIFAFTKEQTESSKNLAISKADSFDESNVIENAMRIEELEMECELLEERLNKERDNYQKLTSVDGSTHKKSYLSNKSENPQLVPVSALPYFSINDSFVLQDNASYLLTIECEAPIDCVVFQSEIQFDLIDCERNQAVISLSDNQHSSFYNSNIQSGQSNNNQILTTFRCQTNTTRLDLKISSIEGQFGQFRAYILTKVTPKSCQVRNYTIKALSLHKRKYFGSSDKKSVNNSTQIEPTLNYDERQKDFLKNANSLTITGQFSLNEAYNWLYLTLPEIPDRINNLTNENRIEFTFQSTLVATYLKIELNEGRMYFMSDNVSTISILKDFITREATRRSIPVELKLDLNKSSINTVLTAIHSKLKLLIKHRNHMKLKEAIQEIETVDGAIASKMSKELDESEKRLLELGLKGDHELDRMYGLITDLFIDYEKLNGNCTKNMMNIFKVKLQEMITLIETYVGDEYTVDVFKQKITEFWKF